MKTRKTLLMLLSLVLVAVVSVAGTLAYLNSKTDPVTNTFTVGAVEITLDEAKVTNLGVKDGDDRVIENEYKLYPNHEYVKDPIVHVDDDSEDCWLFVKVENGIEDIEDTANTIAAQLATNGWTLVDGETDVYAYKEVVSGGANIPVFESFKIAETVDNDTLAEYDGETVVVTALAVQADGFATAADAYAKVKF